MRLIGEDRELWGFTSANGGQYRTGSSAPCSQPKVPRGAGHNDTGPR